MYVYMEILISKSVHNNETSSQCIDARGARGRTGVLDGLTLHKYMQKNKNEKNK